MTTNLDDFGGRDNNHLLSLERVPIDANWTPVLLFTKGGDRVLLHYRSEPEIRDYVHCLGDDCLLCRLEQQEPTERLLLPVYLPLVGDIGVLPVSPSIRPRALLPQLQRVEITPDTVLLIRRSDRASYHTKIESLPPDVDRGAAQIAEFVVQYDAGKLSLGNTYPRIPNDELRQVPGIAQRCRLLLTEDDEGGEVSEDTNGA